MEFVSLAFLIFFPIVVIAYFLTPHRYRWAILLAASYYFYASLKLEYTLLIAFSTLVTYLIALQLPKCSARAAKTLLIVGLVYHVIMLFVFKYFNFFTSSLRDMLHIFSITFDPWTLAILAPIGISFYTFQAMSYIIDVYGKKIEPEQHIGIFATYIAFFPKVISGPIERGKNLLPQFREKKEFTYDRTTSGLALMLLGFFKKALIADQLAIVVDAIYSNPTHYSGAPLIIATIFFVLQLYFDFSGYTDIALGAAEVLGFKLTQNFRRPYYAKNIAEFWRRWHISLSSWFQDYVFTPLYLWLGKQKAMLKLAYQHRHYLAFAIAILIGDALLGLWHGANWTFVTFGVYHGALVALYYIFRKYWDKMHYFLQVCLTFFLVIIGFVIFRANSVSDAWYIITHIFAIKPGEIGLVGTSLDISRTTGYIVLAAIIFVEVWQLFYEDIETMGAWQRRVKIFIVNHDVVRWSVYLLMVVAMLLFGPIHHVRFIYAQF